jgi:hypothetical protein
LRLRPCVVAGCGELTPFSRCRGHAEQRAEAIRDDRARREPWRYLYGLKLWREAREAARRQAGYRCEECGAGEELGVRALDVHHSIKLATLWRRAAGGTPRFDQGAFERAATHPLRLKVLCDPCHVRLELQAEELGRDRLWREGIGPWAA